VTFILPKHTISTIFIFINTFPNLHRKSTSLSYIKFNGCCHKELYNLVLAVQPFEVFISNLLAHCCYFCYSLNHLFVSLVLAASVLGLYCHSLFFVCFLGLSAVKLGCFFKKPLLECHLLELGSCKLTSLAIFETAI